MRAGNGELSLNPDPRNFRAIGSPVPRKEDARLLTGRGRFSDDFNLPGQMYAAIVRSLYPHARITEVNTDRASAMPGVVAVFTGKDCKDDGLGPIPHSPVPSTRTDLKLTAPDGGPIFTGPHAVLPLDNVRHVGEPVAMVVADSREQALDAAEAVEAGYDPLPWVADSVVAAGPGAPVVWQQVPDNVCCDTTFGDPDATTAAFEAAVHTLKMTFRVGRITGLPLEPRVALASFDSRDGRYTLYAGSNGAVRHKHQIAAALGVDPDDLRILCFDVGGNFGTKNRVYTEFCLALWAARKLGRPVKYTATRSESFLSDYQARDLVTEVELAMSAEGRFLGYRASNLSNVGAWIVSLSPLGKGIALVTGGYRFDAATARARAVFTNTAPTQAYRSSGRPEVIHALERMIDTAAREFGFDPIELRRRNLAPSDAMPFTNPLGVTYDSGEYAANMNRALELADWDGFPRRQAAARACGLRLGRGFANYVESSIGAPGERAELTVRSTGAVELVIGTQPTGQGQETSFAQVTADLLGVSVDAVQVVMGDTDIVRAGGGSHSGRSMRQAATILYSASRDLVDTARAAAAARFRLSASKVLFEDGVFRGPEPGQSADWFELAESEDLSVVREHEFDEPVFPNGCAACEVEVDPETGFVRIQRYVAVDDVGRVINPLIVDGQTHGCIAQGVGQALWEQCVIDAESGQPVCGSLMDYTLCRADELPMFHTALNEVLSPTNPLGIKSGGEGPTTPALAAVINAIVDALHEYGVRDIEMPATPLRVWNAIRAARASRGEKTG